MILIFHFLILYLGFNSLFINNKFVILLLLEIISLISMNISEINNRKWRIILNYFRSFLIGYLLSSIFNNYLNKLINYLIYILYILISARYSLQKYVFIPFTINIILIFYIMCELRVNIFVQILTHWMINIIMSILFIQYKISPVIY